ncbi:nucleotidyl transferase AbiEii/AbiGii toxin family protein [Deinococcus pimensis]|uniref:nucleotidyl transferase AbiEii/AbiGii toxin family protein n=1 Tax=Deinococcus pimensis TaxID=309888 RepID=UPI0004B28A43|nr:nucleotidyl transferase AbiEii/AbiGii toxin family protein [Deinococcus pimensis]
MSKPQHATGYGERTTEAVRRVLIDIAHLLGPYREQLVVVGGLVPSLILASDEAHIGTMDIDLALDAAVLKEDDAYAEVIRLLEGGGFFRNEDGEHPDLRAFQMATLVDLQDDGHPVKVEVDLLIPDGVKLDKHRPPLVKGLRTLAMKGIDIALQHATECVIEGRTRRGRRDSATLRVAGAEAFLVLKGLALLGRREPKDAYDVYYTIRNAPEGPEALGRACKVVQHHPDAARAYEAIGEKFAHTDSYGPGAVLDFLQDDDVDEAGLLLDAQRQVRSWHAALHERNEARQEE